MSARVAMTELFLANYTCMDAHMALKKLTMTKVRMVSHCSRVKLPMAMFSVRMV